MGGKDQVPTAADPAVPAPAADEVGSGSPSYDRMHSLMSATPEEVAEAERTAEELTRAPVFGVRKKWRALSTDGPAHAYLATNPSSAQIREAVLALFRAPDPFSTRLRDRYRWAARHAALNTLWDSDTLTPEDRGALMRARHPGGDPHGGGPGDGWWKWVRDPRLPADVSQEVRNREGVGWTA